MHSASTRMNALPAWIQACALNLGTPTLTIFSVTSVSDSPWPLTHTDVSAICTYDIRASSSAEIEVAHNMAHLVATPRRRRRRKRRRRTRRRLKRRRRRRKEEERGGGGGEAKGRRRWKHAFSFGMEIRAVCTLHFLKEKDGAQRRRALHFLKEILVARTLGFG